MTERVSDNPLIQNKYEELLAKGVSPKLAEMLAFRRPPQALTDREFFQGFGTLESQFSGDPIGLNEVVRSARRHGYRPNPNDVYVPSLARFPGDPEAFVPPTGGRGYIKKLCEKRGWACDGAVKTDYVPPNEEPKAVPLAKDIIDEEISARIQKEPSLKFKPREELEAQVIEDHGPQD